MSVVTIPARARHTATVIFAHGLGDSGEGWSFLGEQLGALPLFSHVKWILPTAPVRPVTLNMGMMMRSWYDIKSLDGVNDEEDEENMMKSAKQIHHWVTNEVNNGIQSERIVVGGFSQGCVISLLSGLTYEKRLGGIIGLSGYLPLRNKIQSMITESNLKTPIFMAHGKCDTIVRFDYGRISAKIMKDQMKLDVEWKEYDNMQHTTSQKEIKDMSLWLEKIIG